MAELLKNMFSATFVEELAAELNRKTKNFNRKKFIGGILDADWENRELKDRMHHITRHLNESLEQDYEDQLAVIDHVAPLFRGFTGTVFPNFVEKYGQHAEARSLEALKFYTPFSTSEFAIRPFLKKNPDLIKTLYDWSRDKNFHVRRLSSEGCRPLLPWAMKLEQYVTDPKPILPILERLKNDPEDYVYRSVANNLNDISKNQPDLVLDLGLKWKGKSDTTDWVLKHALRTLLKRGNADAMKLFGFAPGKSLDIIHFSIAAKAIPIGHSTQLSVHVANRGKSSKFRFEYAISYLKNNGTYSDKVFQIAEKTLGTNQEEVFEKKLDFKNLSTRKHYPGKHFISLKINGVVSERASFTLK
ncbi:MAG: DNA alkylation repair protein [Bacteroidetes bacterium]|nr:DNA alkylation repair protein [Bacteroidota bacterium]